MSFMFYLGPAWLPLIGCFLIFVRLRSKYEYTYLALQQLAHTYGPVLGLKFGNQKIVVISTYDLVKKNLLRDELNGRPDGFFFRARAMGKRKGILFTDGTTWSQSRRFTMRHLRTFGMGQSAMKMQITIEIQEFINHLQKISEHDVVPMHRVFDVAVLNSLWLMIAGHRFDYEDEKLQQVLKVVHDIFRSMNTMGGLLSQMPFLRFIIPELSGYNELIRIHKVFWSFIGDEIKIHENNPPENEPRDLIDAFLLEISNKNGDKDNVFDRENLLILCLDLFLAGSKTTIDTLGSIFLFLSLHPEWLGVIQAELDSVVGRSRAPTEEDLPLLPITEAFLAEIQRYFILAPLGVPHCASEDVILNEYRIPKGTLVLFNLYSVENDEAYWDEPNLFRPRRFLDERGQFRRNNFSLPFGLGKRRCLGEQLARSALFLFFTNIVHYFDMKISTDHDKPDLKCYDGFTLSPKPYYLKLTKRSE
ncbi:methyl farnesoate epoxidase isoform X2 [Anoplolepis gracilipes]|uniref:methyl farnesoate epoxidase isoform X2 n=1 Tax=Anoplolepis gracilipes TaxID=354296 RepID=UPI003BA23D4F